MKKNISIWILYLVAIPIFVLKTAITSFYEIAITQYTESFTRSNAQPLILKHNIDESIWTFITFIVLSLVFLIFRKKKSSFIEIKELVLLFLGSYILYRIVTTFISFGILFWLVSTGIHID